jgi:hypothetical protein
MTPIGIPGAATEPLFEGDTISVTIDQRNRAAVTAGVLHLVSIGVLGAANIVLFAVASVSLLGRNCAIANEVLPT